jgi:hypothetical protein
MRCVASFSRFPDETVTLNSADSFKCVASTSITGPVNGSVVVAVGGFDQRKLWKSIQKQHYGQALLAKSGDAMSLMQYYIVQMSCITGK